MPGDIEIFRLIYEYCFLRAEHISALTDYLKSIRLPQRKHIYGLNKKAIAVPVEQGIGNAELLSQRVRIHELKELFLKHEMMIVDLHVILELVSRESLFRLMAWREGRGLFDYVSVADYQGVRKLPVRPDAFFTLEDSRRKGANRTSFFLEADHSTDTQTRFKEKMGSTSACTDL